MPATSKLTAQTTILGFTGSIGSGCTYIAQKLAKDYDYQYFCLSDFLKEIAQDEGIKSPTIKDLQDIGNRFRKNNNGSYLVERLIKKLTDEINNADDKGIIVDSIRNDKEVEALRQFPFFYLFSIHAGKEVRRKRTVGIKFPDEKSFDDADKRDQAESDPFGQQVKKCNDLADIIINNDEHIARNNRRKSKEFIDKIYNSYVALIENNKAGHLEPENEPSINETLMTMAYAESRLSSCLKRKVGAIIASVKEAASLSQPESEKAIKKTFSVISSGHNEVPLGTIPCAFNADNKEKCHRDYLKEKHTQKIRHCPQCGTKINFDFSCDECRKKISNYVNTCPECNSNIEIEYLCPKCNSNVFKEYLISAGKLLDVCRALHAEEQALLSLTKAGIRKENAIILFTTTFPCNLCANKIVAAGIDKVIYAEPYPMEEAVKTLKAGNVKIEKFEGIKSSAFFKLYKT